MTPAEAARAVAGDLDLIGTDQADWAARWWYRYAHYLSTPELTHVYDAPNCMYGSGHRNPTMRCGACAE